MLAAAFLEEDLVGGAVEGASVFLAAVFLAAVFLAEVFLAEVFLAGAVVLAAAFFAGAVLAAGACFLAGAFVAGACAAWVIGPAGPAGGTGAPETSGVVRSCSATSSLLWSGGIEEPYPVRRDRWEAERYSISARTSAGMSALV